MKTAEVMGFEEEGKKRWVSAKLELIDTGEAEKALDALRGDMH